MYLLSPPSLFRVLFSHPRFFVRKNLTFVTRTNYLATGSLSSPYTKINTIDNKRVLYDKQN
ncbi:hypothetical protein CW304_19070 [Bacillus sp. UFRGS-B20]|nr:hypothetical protein CW304_19070 [Bacillus sp. UFRGS-B20]